MQLEQRALAEMQKQNRQQQLLQRIRNQKNAIRYMTDVALADEDGLETLAPQYKPSQKTIANVIADIAHLRALPPGDEQQKQPVFASGELLLSTNANTIRNDFSQTQPTPAESVENEHGALLNNESVCTQTDELLMVSAAQSIGSDSVGETCANWQLDYDTLVKLVIPECCLRNCRCDKHGKCFCGCCDRHFINRVELERSSGLPDRVDLARAPESDFEREVVTYAEAVTDGRIVSCLEHFPRLQHGVGVAKSLDWAALIAEAVTCSGIPE